MGEAVSNSLPLNIVTVFIPVLFYFLGLSSNLEQFKRIFTEKKSLIYGLGIQLILLPLIGLLISELFSNSLFAVAEPDLPPNVKAAAVVPAAACSSL